MLKLRGAMWAGIAVLVLCSIPALSLTASQEQNDQAVVQEQNKQAAAQAQESNIPTADADLGRCSADFLVTDAEGNPLPDAEIRAQIPYGLRNRSTMHLSVKTNSDGKARFINLSREFMKMVGDEDGKARFVMMPAWYQKKVFFRVTHEKLDYSFAMDPVAGCQQVLTVALGKEQPVTSVSLDRIPPTATEPPAAQ